MVGCAVGLEGRERGDFWREERKGARVLGGWSAGVGILLCSGGSTMSS